MAIEKVRCLKCGYEWYPNSESPPKVCPKCKSYEWDKNRVKVVNE